MNEQIHGKEVYCKKCDKVFYVRGFRLCNAKTTTCFYCGWRINCKTKDIIKEFEEVGQANFGSRGK